MVNLLIKCLRGGQILTEHCFIIVSDNNLSLSKGDAENPTNQF